MLHGNLWTQSPRKGWANKQSRKIGPLMLWIEKHDSGYSIEVKTLAGSLVTRAKQPDGSPIPDEVVARDIAENEARAVLRAFLEELDSRPLLGYSGA